MRKNPHVMFQKWSEEAAVEARSVDKVVGGQPGMQSEWLVRSG